MYIRILLNKKYVSEILYCCIRKIKKNIYYNANSKETKLKYYKLFYIYKYIW